MTSALENARHIARKRQAKVVFPEMDEPRIQEAAKRLREQGLAVPVTLSDPSETHAQALIETRGMKDAIAHRMVAKPLIRAAAMVASGEADLMVAGAASPTKRVIEAALMAVGLRQGITAPSSFFLMCFPDGRDVIFADCAVNVDPDAEALAGIATASAASGQALLGASEVALLSYATGTSGAGASVDKVAEAARLSGLNGPLQGDAAVNAQVATLKGAEGGGQANVLVFPNLDAGNIAYKLAQEFAGARAYGPILQGFKKPICDLSRGASVEDIVASTLLSIALLDD